MSLRGFALRRFGLALCALASGVGLPLAALSAWNWHRLDGEVLGAELEKVVARAERLREGARVDYQAATLGALPPNPLTGAVHRLDDHLEDAGVLREPTLDGAGRSGIVFALELDDRIPFAPARGRSTLAQGDGALAVVHGEDDYLESTAPVDVPMDDVGDVVIRAKLQRGTHIGLAWSTEPDPADPWFNRLDIPVVSTGAFHTYVINAKNAMKRGVREGDHIRRLYLRASDVAGDRVEIDFIRFMSKRTQYLKAPRGVAYERLAAELRRVLYMLPDQELAWTLRVPEDAPRLDLGLGVLADAAPVTFRVHVDSTGVGETLLLERTLADASGWRDERLDLAPWAGKGVRLRLSVDGAAENVGFWSSPVVSPAPETPFRVILLLEDTMRADRLSVHGHERPTTPFKERWLAEDGVVFLNMASQSTKTRTSVPTLMTSLLPTATGVWNFADMLSDRYLTLAEVLRQQGFVTASFVQNGNAGPFAGMHQGFDTLLDAETIDTTPGGIFGPELDAWLGRHADRNFFLYLHVMDPHGVYEPDAPYDTWYRELPPGAPEQPRDEHLDPDWVERPTVPGRRALYDGEIARNDATIERFVEQLRERDLYDGTFFVLTSDHGEYLGERGLWEHEPPGLLHVTGVPLAFVHPQRFPGGERRREHVQTLDIMPTVLEVAGVAADGILMQGDSLVGLAEGRETQRFRDRVTLSEEPDLLDKTDPWRNRGLRVTGSFFYRGRHFVTSRRFWPGRGYWPELFRMKVYDVEADRLATSPLRAFSVDLHMHYRFARLLNDTLEHGRAAWRQWTEAESQSDHRFDPDALDQLRALGYIE